MGKPFPVSADSVAECLVETLTDLANQARAFVDLLDQAAYLAAIANMQREELERQIRRAIVRTSTE